MAEVVLASGATSRRSWVRDGLLAAAASASAQVATGASVGVLVTLVWVHAGRGAVPLVLGVVVPVVLVLLDLVPRGLAADLPAERRGGVERRRAAAGGGPPPTRLGRRG